jgi:transposase InsO family protein
MRYPATEKLEIIRLLEQSHLPVKQTLDKLGIPRPTFYRWYDRFLTHGLEGLEDRTSAPSRVWNRIPDDIRDRIITMALDHAELSPRELAVTFTDAESYFVSEASVYRLLKAHDLITSPAFIVIKAGDEFKKKTTRPNEMWQTDFPYLKVIGWGWFYLSTVRDDFSRDIIAWKLCTSMKVDDVTDPLNLALAPSGCDSLKVEHRPRLLSDNGPCDVAEDLGAWLEKRAIEQVHGAPSHPQTQGKIERWHQTLKNRILLENDFFPQDLEMQIAAFVEHYNQSRYHQSLGNLTPADVYFGRGTTILLERERIKRETIRKRRLMHHRNAAYINPQTEPEAPIFQSPNRLKSFDDGQSPMGTQGDCRRFRCVCCSLPKRTSGLLRKCATMYGPAVRRKMMLAD